VLLCEDFFLAVNLCWSHFFFGVWLIHMGNTTDLTRIATLCNTLQHTATRYNTLQPLLQLTGSTRVATQLQHAATRRNTLQHTAIHCKVYYEQRLLQRTDATRVATHYNTLQHTVMRCNTLQHTPTHSNTLQHTPTHCSIHCDTLIRHKLFVMQTI